MIIKKIKLENIRSYLNQELNFPIGSVLLSGDIGTGKSSILLAIDFALFGLRRGTLSGSSLLRNGKNSGSVELDFTIDDKDVTIKRTLKRTPESVVQDSGYILINGTKKEGTAVELKQTILDLLNYPKELLTKSKSLIYRYTIYTPQEEMKHILLGDKDFRLDTLRKVFGIDKYKRIKENTEKFVSNLKGKRKEFSGMIADLEEKKSEREEKEKEIKSVEEKIKTLLPILNKIKKEETEKKTQIKEIEDKINKLKELKQELAIANTELNNKLEQRKENEKELKEIEKQIKNLEIELKDKKEINIEKIKKEIQEIEKKISKLEDKIKEFNNKINEFEVKKNNSIEIKNKISTLDTCPLCKQKVTERHIREVLEKENHNINLHNKDIEKNKEQLEKEEKKLNQHKQDLEKLKEKQNNFEFIKLKIESLREKNQRKENMSSSQSKLKKEIGQINLKKSNLFKEIENFKDIEKTYEKEKSSLEELQEKLKETEIKKVSLDKEIEYVKNIIIDLEKEIKEKSKIKENLLYLNQLQYWLESHFTKLMETMEKKIMVKIHYDFNSLFQKWFDMLIDSELLNIKLDEEFTPVIIQNGYEIDYNYLSGGEKTAAALAYRLALNQIINTLIAVIKTKDLLILDEPTDGFSTEQLDRVKIVLDELDTKQVILVSHEAKVESFVEKVIKFDKKEHVTEINE